MRAEDVTVAHQSHAVQLAGTVVQAWSCRALYWAPERTLLVADMHLGKAATLRHAGIAVPGGTGAATLERLAEVIALTRAERVIVLGDLVHARAGCTQALDALVQAWRARQPAFAWDLLGGNHDRSAGVDDSLLGRWGLGQIAEGCVLGPFRLAHHPHAHPDAYVLCGHTHPAIRLQGPGRDRARLPCFWFGPTIGVLPAFGVLTGHFDVRPAAGDQVLAVGDGFIQPV